MERPNAWKNYTKTDLKKLEEIAKEYKAFIDAGKTERECAVYAVAALEKAGYVNLETLIGGKKKLKAGDKVYVNRMGKAILTFHIGKKPLCEGMNIVGAHIDSPRLDLKQNPLYEDNDYVLADTHYYGGVKKYQWTARELALHGVVVKKDGTVVNICIGEKDDDPVVGISDLLIHLSHDQLDKKLREAITGENLDIMLGGKPLKGEEKEPVKAQILKILNYVAELLELTVSYSELNVRRTLQNSRMLSCDVSAGFDPLYASAFEKKNSAQLGRGVCFNKYTGSGGKGGSNDANAEYMAKLRRILDENKVCWQTAELGKVDQGGGGTIAYICALYGMEVIDSGLAVLNMHAPMEIISKADLYEAVKGYTAFMLQA